MNPCERLCDVFERGLRDGYESLSAEEHELYLIQDFIIEMQMSGLSGYMYNRLPNRPMLRSTIDAMRRHGCSALAEILGQALEMFEHCVLEEETEDWDDVLRRYDPSDRLQLLTESFLSLKDNGIGDSAIGPV